jgi:hypothetical protein
MLNFFEDCWWRGFEYFKSTGQGADEAFPGGSSPELSQSSDHPYLLLDNL